MENDERQTKDVLEEHGKEISSIGNSEVRLACSVVWVLRIESTEDENIKIYFKTKKDNCLIAWYNMDVSIVLFDLNFIHTHTHTEYRKNRAALWLSG